nr:Stp1/IreP family PP2C-type Ser/Thr phosphatase [Armatimonadota bacterium]
MKITFGAKTDQGRRPNNEDKLLVVDVRRHGLRADGVLVIADGMGGRNFGERAASAAVEAVGDTLIEMLQSEHDPPVDIGDALDSSLRKANSRVYELAGQDSEHKGMGTTCVAAVIENDQVYVAHAGDSRAYLLREGELQRLTDDHSFVAEQVRAGKLSEENARTSRFRNVITRAVGIEPTITPDVARHDVRGGDLLLLCTDGLTNMVDEKEIARIMAEASSAQAAADKLVNLANRNGGRDNITAIVALLELGNRTQRMRAGDLAQLVPPSSAIVAAPPPPAELSAAPEDDEDEEEYEDEEPSRRPARRGRGARVAITLLSLLFLLAAGCAAYLGSLLDKAGYHFQTEPPFAVKPVPPPPPKPTDLARVTYSAPTLVSVVPMQGGLLTISPKDDSVVALTTSGLVLHLTADGQTVFKYALPKQFAPPDATTSLSASAAPVPAPTQRLHWATDPQGNLYVTDAVKKTLTKYRYNGVFLRSVATGLLKQPEALAVAADGSIYVVDAQR